MEQRVARRAWPRTELEFEQILSHSEYRTAKNKLWSRQAYPWTFVDQTRMFHTTVGIPTNAQTAIPIGETPSWVSTGRVLVFTDGNRWESVVIAEMFIEEGVRYIRIDRPMASDWLIGSRVYYGLIGRFAASTALVRHTSAAATLSVGVDVLPASEIPPPYEPRAHTRYYQGFEVFMEKPNWANPVSGTLIQSPDVVDFTAGPVFEDFPVDFGREDKTATYLAANGRVQDSIVGLFYRCKGRQGEFYMPTWESDIALRKGASGSANSVRVEGVDIIDAYTESRTHRHLFFQLRDGEVLFAEVASYEEVFDSLGRDTIITLTDSVGVTLSADSVTQAGWLLRQRFANDTLSQEFLTSSVCNILVATRTLPLLPLE